MDTVFTCSLPADRYSVSPFRNVFSRGVRTEILYMNNSVVKTFGFTSTFRKLSSFSLSLSHRTFVGDGGWPPFCMQCPWMWAGMCLLFSPLSFTICDKTLSQYILKYRCLIIWRQQSLPDKKIGLLLNHPSVSDYTPGLDFSWWTAMKPVPVQ